MALLGLVQVTRYVMDYEILSEYGKGYVWGSIALLLIGMFLIIVGVRKKKSSFS